METAIQERANAVWARYRELAKDDLLTFALGLKIPSATGPQRFQDCIADFQRETFADFRTALHAVKAGDMPPIRRIWCERTKKASKDADLGVCLLWLTAFATRPLYCQVGAADRDQAAIVKRRIKDILHLNPWLDELVEIQRYKILGKNGMAEVDILAADIGGSHGETPDVLVINELSHVTRTEFLQNLMDNARGVPHGVVIVATNAGIKGSMPDKWRTEAIEQGWKMRLWQRPAPWIAKSDLEEAKRFSTRSRYQRLWWGKWSSGTGDALDEEDIDAIFKDKDGKARAAAQTEAAPGWQYVAGLDLGVKHDHAGSVILGCNREERRIVVARSRDYAPDPRTGEVDLDRVETDCLADAQTFNVRWFGFDPNQAQLMAQRLRKRHVKMIEQPFVGKHLDAMANTLIQVCNDRLLECYEDETLRRDFGKLCILEKSYGYKLDAVSDEWGHADVATALVIALPKAVELIGGMGKPGVISQPREPEKDETGKQKPPAHERLGARFKELAARHGLFR